MQEPAGGEFFAQVPDQRVGLLALGRADGGGVPFGGFEIVDRDEGRFAAHGEADIIGGQHRVHVPAERIERIPAFVGEGLGDAGMFGDAGHRHGKVEFGVRLAKIAAADRRGIAVMRRGSKRDGFRRSKGLKSGRGRSSRRRADRPHTRHAGR